MLAYLRLLVNPQDEQALLRVVNYPRRGIGDTTLRRLSAQADEEGRSLWEVMQAVQAHPKGASEIAIGKFVKLIQGFVEAMKEKDTDELALHVVRESGIWAHLKQDAWGFQDKEEWKKGGSRQIENVEALLQGIDEFTRSDEEDHSLAAFLQQVSLLTTADEEKGEDAVSLMTMHACKGLEFKVVFATGLTEGTLPDYRAVRALDIEEERRVFYVAITRAKERLFISYPREVVRYRRTDSTTPSRFLEEIEGAGVLFEKRDDYTNRGSRDWLDRPPARAHVDRGHVAGKGMKRVNALRGTRPAATELRTGDRVLHAKFGTGVVKRVEDYQDTPKVKVLFDQVGEKTLLLAFAKLKILP